MRATHLVVAWALAGCAQAVPPFAAKPLAAEAKLPTCVPDPWPGGRSEQQPPTILGFSASGWMAYHEPDPWQGDGQIFVQHLSCDGECLADTPTEEGDLCYCPPPGSKALTQFEIDGSANYEVGTFPASIDGITYEIHSELQQGDGIAPGSTTQFTAFWLVTEGKERTHLGSVHDHNTSQVDVVCVAGWFRSLSHPQYLQVLVGYGVAEEAESVDTVRYKVMGATL